MGYNNFNRDLTIEDLVAEFEVMSQKGTVTFLEEKDFLRLIEYYQSENVIDRALEVVEFALGHHGFSADFYMKKAQLLIESRQENIALAILDRAEIFSPSDIQIPLLRAEALVFLDQYGDALTILDDLKEHCLYKEELSCIYTVESLVYEGLEQYERVFFALQQALLEDPKNQIALERLWSCVEISKKYEQSVILHEQILDLDPYSHLAWYNLGHAHAYLGNYDEAIEAYEYAYIIENKFEYAYRDCAEMCITINNYKKALDCYQEALEHIDADSDILLKIGQCYQHLKNYSVARSFYQQALNIDPMNDEVFFYIGECYSYEGNWNSAIRYFHKAIRIEEFREEYYAALAEAYYQVGDHSQAATMFKRATDIAPEQSSYWIHYASYLMEVGQGDLALQILNSAEDFSVGVELLYCRIACLFSVGKRQEAKYYLGEALIEDFDMHIALFALSPDLQYDTTVLNMIESYRNDFSL